MANIPIISNGLNTNRTSCYLPIALQSGLSVEASSQYNIRTAGTFSKLSVQVVNNDRTGNGTLKFRKNTADGSQSLSVPGSDPKTGYFEASGSDAVSVDDDINLYWTVGSGGTITSIDALGIIFAATTDSCTLYARIGSIAHNSASATEYYHMHGSATTATTTEANVYSPMLSAGIWQGLGVYISGNARTNDTTIKSRIDGADGYQSVTIGAGLSGSFYQDTTNHDHVSANSNINCSVTTGTGTETITIQTTLSEYITTDYTCTWINTRYGAYNFNAENTYFFAPGGITYTGNTSETNVQRRTNVAGTASKMKIICSAKTGTISLTLKSRKAGSDGSQLISTSLTSGTWYQDSTNSDSVGETETFGYSLYVTGGTSAQFRTCAMLWTTTVAGGNNLAWRLAGNKASLAGVGGLAG